jgi:hypothetical protein
MSWQRNLTLGLVAGGLAIGGFAAAHGLAEARQGPVVVVRFLLGYYDAAGRFVPTAGRNATNVDRNAIVMFQFSGPIDTGPDTRASLALTIAEQAELAVLQARDPEFDPEANGYEPGVIPRRQSDDRAAFYVATGSVSTTSVVIASPQTGGALSAAPGQFFKPLRGKSGDRIIPNRLLFNPRYAVATFNHPQQIDHNPQGLDAATLYEVYIDGGSNPVHPFELLRNLDGSGLAVPFSTTFTTTNRYVQDFSRPHVKTTSPTDGTANVASDADIDLSFDEPMDIASFVAPRFQGDDQWTVVARYTDNPINTTFKGRNLLLQVRIKPQTGGNVVQLRPLQGFGKGPSEIEVIVRNGVTDLSGNNIIRQLQFTFKSAFNANADQAAFIEETFATSGKRDTTFGVGSNLPSGDNVLASWNGSQPGFLAGVVTDTPFVVASKAQAIGTGVNLFGVAALAVQNLYTSVDMGNRPRTITSFAWRATVFNGVTYPNTTIQMGHANDLVQAAGFPGSATTSTGPSITFYRDVPVVVVPTVTYATVGQLSANYVAGPKFAKNFNFDGTNYVILDITHGGNGTVNDRWQVDAAYALQTCIFANFSTTPSTNGTNRWYFDTKFTYLTPGAEAQSLFYDLARDDARVLSQQIVPTNQPTGTSVTFVWQGAKSDTTTPTIPDMTTLTPWLSDVRELSTYRYIRFRATLANNLTQKIAPSLDTITLPFTYK